MNIEKPFADIKAAELLKWPVWKLLPESETRDETWASPVSSLPVKDLSGCIVATDVRLANGQKLFAAIGNIDLRNPKKSMHFRTIRLRRKDGKWFDLARYHDVDICRRGPEALALFLGLSVVDVFPISYDISSVAIGVPDVVKGRVPMQPDEKLSEDDLIQMALG